MTFIWGRYNTGHARGPTRCSRVYMVRGIKLVLATWKTRTFATGCSMAPDIKSVKLSFLVFITLNVDHRGRSWSQPKKSTQS